MKNKNELVRRINIGLKELNEMDFHITDCLMNLGDTITEVKETNEICINTINLVTGNKHNYDIVSPSRLDCAKEMVQELNTLVNNMKAYEQIIITEENWEDIEKGRIGATEIFRIKGFKLHDNFTILIDSEILEPNQVEELLDKEEEEVDAIMQFDRDYFNI